MGESVQESQTTDPGEDFSDRVQGLKLDCLRAAQKNCKILLDLARYGKIGESFPFSFHFAQ